MLIAITGQKGGTGKSTLAVAIAAELHSRGSTVLLVDADAQGTAQTWGDVASESDQPTPTIVAMGATMHQPDQLPRLSEAYDHTIVDCPGRDGKVQRSALLVANLAVLPCGPSAADAWAMAESAEVVSEAQTINADLQAYIVLTRKTRTVLGKQARDVLVSLELPILDTEIGFRVAYQEFLAAGQGISAYAPRDQAAGEIRRLVDELLATSNQTLITSTRKAVANG